MVAIVGHSLLAIQQLNELSAIIPMLVLIKQAMHWPETTFHKDRLSITIVIAT